LSEEGAISAAVVAQAIAKYDIDPNKPNPVTL
jgi:pyruvate dehydrogenase E1 component